MLEILRSLVKHEGLAERQDGSLRYVIETGFKFPTQDENRILEFIRIYWTDYQDLPSLDAITSRFASVQMGQMQSVLSILEKEKAEPVFHGTEFRYHVDQEIAHQRKESFKGALMGAHAGFEKDWTPEAAKKTLEDYSQRVVRQLYDLQCYGEKHAKTSGSPFEEGAEYLTELDKRVALGQQVGVLCGIESVDLCTRGFRPGELVLIAGFAGELKSSLTMNMAYNMAIHFRRNVLFISLEMGYEEVHNLLYSIHSAHSKWKRPHLTTNQLRDGMLSPTDRQFLAEVVADLTEGVREGKYGRILLDQAEHVYTVQDVAFRATLWNGQTELDAVLVDYIGLLEAEPDAKKRGESQTWLNPIIKKLKNMALTFGNGRKIVVISPFQTNRQGKKAADENDGEYRLDALREANEAETSSDLIMTTWLSKDLRNVGQVKVSCIKNRSGEMFKPFLLRVNFDCRKMGEPLSESS